MDFKSLINKIDSIESVEQQQTVLEQPKKVQLDEETAIKFLAGTKTLNEAAEIMEKKLTKAEKEKKEEVVKSMKKDKEGFKERYGKRGEEVMHATATKIAKKKAESVESSEEVISELDMNLLKAAQKGQEGKPIGKPDAESDKNVKKKYGYRMDGEPAERDDDETKQERRGRKRQNKAESIDPEIFRNEFLALVEAKKKESKKDKKMDEGSKPDFLDVDKDGDKKEPMKKAAKEAGKGEKKETKGMTAAQKKLPPGLQKAIAKKKGKTESVRNTKKVVAESVEMKLTFRDMIKLVQESGGQQQIDPLDKTLFAWATRVAQNKFQESAKAEVYAGLVYERMGGRFEMYDVLSESKKKINEEADSRVAKLAKLTIQVMEKDGAKVGPNSDFHTIFDVLEQDYRGQKILRLVKQLDNEDFNTWETMIHDHFMPHEEIDEDWRKKLAAAGMAGVMGLGAMGGANAADMPDRDSASDRAVASQSDSVRLSDLEDQVKDLAKVDRKAAKSYEATKNLYDKWLMKSKSPEDMKRADKDYARSLQTIIKTSSSIN